MAASEKTTPMLLSYNLLLARLSFSQKIKFDIERSIVQLVTKKILICKKNWLSKPIFFQMSNPLMIPIYSIFFIKYHADFLFHEKIEF